jgi:hypothetical protein
LFGLEQVERDRFRIVRLEQLVPFGKKPLLALEESSPFLFRLLPDGFEFEDQGSGGFERLEPDQAAGRCGRRGRTGGMGRAGTS